jgi:ATP-dependent helicase HrpB
MLLEGVSAGEGRLACDAAALLGERDFLRLPPGARDADIRIRLEILGEMRKRGGAPAVRLSFDRSAARRVLEVSDHLARHLRVGGEGGGVGAVGRLLARAYPDRIGRRREGRRGHYLLSGGRGAVLDPAEPLSAEDWLVAAELDGDRRNARIFLAAPLDADAVQEMGEARGVWSQTVAWDPGRGAVRAERTLRLGVVVLRTAALDRPEPDAVLAAMIDGIRRSGIGCLPWNRSLRRWQARALFVSRLPGEEGWPDLSDEGLLASLEAWLAPFLDGVARLRDLAHLDLGGALKTFLGGSRRRLDELAPTHITVPSGSRLPIDYSGDVPVLAVRLQEVFGAVDTPAVGGGRLPLLLHLLSPAGRPVQVTRDLAGFWKTGYPEVRKELRGRYPRHSWPEDPLTAVPTARAKPGGRRR